MSEEIETEEVVEEETTEEEAEESTVETEESGEETTEEDVDWKARAIKAEGLIQKHKTKAKTVKKETPTDSKTLERMQLQLDGYPIEIVDQIMDLGGKEFLNNDIGKKAVDILVKQATAEKAAKIETTTKSSFEKKYTPEDLRNMSVEEMEKILPKAE